MRRKADWVAVKVAYAPKGKMPDVGVKPVRELARGTSAEELLERLKGLPFAEGKAPEPIGRPELLVPVHKSNDLVTFERPVDVGAGRKQQ